MAGIIYYGDAPIEITLGNCESVTFSTLDGIILEKNNKNKIFHPQEIVVVGPGALRLSSKIDSSLELVSGSYKYEAGKVTITGVAHILVPKNHRYINLKISLTKVL